MKNRDSIMKKNTFLNGAFITALGIIITKSLGIIYVIPFHSLIGEDGGALYGYAYTVYTFIISLSSAGIPLAISRIVSEYQTLGYYKAKKRAFILAKRISIILGVLFFLIMMLFAPIIAKSILGDISGGNTIQDVSFVIRVISSAILIVPLLSIYRGFFEGHRFMSPPSISQVIEQLFRVTLILLGSYVSMKVFKLDLSTTIGVALFGTVLGAFMSYVYLVDKMLKNKSKFNEKVREVNEPIITNKTIIKKILLYAFPFIMIDFGKSLYSYIDMVTVVKGLVNFASYNIKDAEAIYSMLSTWTAKFNMVVLSLSTGIVVSLVPILTENVVKKDYYEVNRKIIQALNVLLFLTIPITLGISFLSKPIWGMFYGESLYGPSVLSYNIFVGLVTSLFTALVVTLMALKDYKSVFISLFTGVILKLLLNVTLLITFNKMSLPPYYGVITATIIGYFVSFIICLLILKFKYNIVFEDTIKNFINIICASILMFIVLFIFKLFIPITSTSRLYNLLIIIVYGIIGSITYFAYSYFSGLLYGIFENKLFKYLKKLKK